MKKFLSILGITAVIAVVMVSCGNNQAQVAAETARQLERYKDSIRLAADTAGMAEFRNWKAQNELMNSPQYQEMQYAAAAAAPVARSYYSAPRRSYSSAPRRTYSSSRSRSYSGGGYSNSTASYPAKKRSRWSKAAKGAVIGGAGGAIAGAVINKKNRAVGAVVGGVLGGAGGYVTGRGMDKRDGRY